MMESYLMMLYVTLEQESALKKFFMDQGWAYCKPDLSVTTDELGPAGSSVADLNKNSESVTSATGKRKAKAVPKSAPKVKQVKVLAGTAIAESLSGNKRKKRNKKKYISETENQDTEQLNEPVSDQSEDEENANVIIKVENVQENIGDIEEDDAEGAENEDDEGAEIEDVGDEDNDDTDIDDCMEVGDIEENVDEAELDLKSKTKGNKGHRKDTAWQEDTKRSRICLRYDRENLKRAYEATLTGMSVYRASRVYGVPESTLRDRTRHNVSIDCRTGPDTLLGRLEEEKLAEHIKYMADISYGYSTTHIRYLAAEYARSTGKKVRAKEELSFAWFYAFLKRHPDLKDKLDLSRTKCATQETTANYSNELWGILSDNNLLNAPDRIFIIEETGIHMQHSPTNNPGGRNSKSQAVSPSKSSRNITIIGGANALGNSVPPFYVFPGKRWNDKFIEGAPQGSGGAVSHSGWSNTDIFEKYVTEHLAKHVSLKAAGDRPATLILYDGHMSQLSLTLADWAEQRNVILFVLPPHTSPFTQPLEAGVFGPLKSYYYSECQQYLQENPGVPITKFELAQLTAIPYLKAFCQENIISAFRESGIYPFDDKCISAKVTETPEEEEPETSGESHASKSSQSMTKDAYSSLYSSPDHEEVIESL